jgi:hypothetical protein
VRFCGIDDIIALIEPVAHQRLDQGGRMLAVTIHEQDAAHARMIEAGDEGGFLAEIARKGDHLNIERLGGKTARSGKGCVAAAVIDIHHLGCKAAGVLQAARHFDQTRVQGREVIRLVE